VPREADRTACRSRSLLSRFWLAYDRALQEQRACCSCVEADYQGGTLPARRRLVCHARLRAAGLLLCHVGTCIYHEEHVPLQVIGAGLLDGRVAASLTGA